MLHAQQGRGLFFSTFGTDAPPSFGRFSTFQAYYFEIPATESRTVFLRVFDADVGGIYDEKHGRFNTQTRFVVLGGASAGRLFDGRPEIETNMPEWDSADALYDKALGESRALDGKWSTLRELPLKNGFQSGEFSRFVLLVISGPGDDANFYDLALSYDRNAKTSVPGSRAWVYSLSLRNPSLLAYGWESFQGQLVFKAPPGEPLELHTFDMDDVPVSVVLETEPVVGESSGDGNWIGNRFDTPASGIIRFNFFGRDFNNTFGLVLQNRANEPVPLFLPILDYQPGTLQAGNIPSGTSTPATPKAVQLTAGQIVTAPGKTQASRAETLEAELKSAFSFYYETKDCSRLTFKADNRKFRGLQNTQVLWEFADTSVSGFQFNRAFRTPGYYPFAVRISGMEESRPINVEWRDSVLVNTPPVAWAGADRTTVPGRYIVFDGTVSEDRDGRIAFYAWDLGDGTKMQGARVDHIYRKSGIYDVTLSVRDDSGSPCAEASARTKIHVNAPPVANIAAPSYVMQGERFILDGSASVDPDGSIVEYLWKIGSGEILTGQKVEYENRQGGNINVLLTVKDNAEVSNSISKAEMTIRSNALPVAVAGDDKRVSPGKPATFSATRSYDPDGKVVRHEWDFGNGVLKNGAVVQHGFEKPGSYPVVLKVTDNTGMAFSTDSMEVWVNAPPEISIEGKTKLSEGRIQLSAEGSKDPDGEIISYEWNLADGRIFTGPTLNAIVKTPGTHKIRLIVTDDSRTASSIVTEEIEVTVNRLPVAQISGPRKVSAGEPNRFSGIESTDPDGKITRFEWDFGDGTTYTGSEAEHKFNKPGIFQVQLKVLDDSGLDAGFDVATHEVRVNAPPAIFAQPMEKVIPGRPVRIDLSSSTDPDGRKLAFSWQIDGKWIPGPAVREIVPKPGQDSIQVMADDGEGILSSKTTAWVRLPVNRAPIAVISPKSIKTDRKSVQFNASASYDPDGDPLQYSWDFGDGKLATGTAVSHTYKFGGRYKVTLTADDGRGLENSMASDTASVLINQSPSVYFTTPDVVCAGAPVQYEAGDITDPDGDPLRFFWTFGDGSSAVGKDGSHTYLSEGRFQIMLTVDDGQNLSNSLTSHSRTINVVGAPAADAGPDRTICRTDVLELSAAASRLPSELVMDIDWDFGDGKKGFGMQESHKYDKPGVYKVKLTIKNRGDAGCEMISTDEMTVTVIPELLARFDVPDFVGIGDSLKLDPSSSISTHYSIKSVEWFLNDEPLKSWNLRENGRGEKNWVTAGARPGLTLTQPFQQGRLPVTVTQLGAGDHRLTLVLSAESSSNCNEARKTVKISVQNRPDLAISDVPVLTPRIPFVFSVREASGRIAQLAGADWDFGDGKKAAGFFVSHGYQEPGTYTVVMSARLGRSNAAVYRLSKEVKVNAPPKAEPLIPEIAYVNEPVILNAAGSVDPDGNITSIMWSTSDGGRYSGQTASHTFTKKGLASVTLTLKDDSPAGNNTTVFTRQITVLDIPSFTLNLEAQVCPGSSVNIMKAANLLDSDSLRAGIFVGDKPVSFKQAKDMRFQFPGVYTVRIEPAGARATASAAINGVKKSFVVNAPPQVFAEVPMTINLNMANANAVFNCSKAFDPNGDLFNATWDLGDGTKKPGKTIRHQYKNPGTYKVVLTLADDRNLTCSTSRQEFVVKVVRE